MAIAQESDASALSGSSGKSFCRAGFAMALFVTLRSPRHFAGVLHVGFQIILMLGGNYAFLNHLTIVPCLALFDDAFLLKYAELLPSSWNLYVTASVYKGMPF